MMGKKALALKRAEKGTCMNHRKRTLAAAFGLFLPLLLASCGSAQNAGTAEEAAEEKKVFPAFTVSTLDGGTASSDDLKDYDVTMVNVWGTFCGPCIAEMGDLETLSSEMPEGTRLVGLALDARDAKTQETAKDILSQYGCTFENWVPDDDALYVYINENVTAVPTTYFLGSDGTILGDPVTGAVGKDRYEAALKERLEEVSE